MDFLIFFIIEDLFFPRCLRRWYEGFKKKLLFNLKKYSNMKEEKFIINLPNGETFITNNEKAYELIQKIAHPYGDDGVTKDELDEIDDAEVKEIINRFLGWNEVYCDKECGILMMEKHLINEWHMSGCFDETFEEYLEFYYNKVESI